MPFSVVITNPSSFERPYVVSYYSSFVDIRVDINERVGFVDIRVGFVDIRVGSQILAMLNSLLFFSCFTILLTFNEFRDSFFIVNPSFCFI